MIKRLGIQFQEPPCIIVEMMHVNTDLPKVNDHRTFVKKIYIKKLDVNMDPEAITSKILRTYPDIFNSQFVDETQILILVRQLLTGDRSPTTSTSTLRVEDVTSIDLNKVSEEENILAKMSMDTEFEIHRLRPGDEGFEYDRVAHFTACEPSNWDNDDE